MRSIWMSIVMAAMLIGCATQKMSGDQLARVAKDWSLSIRASQVIPVYPLTEDLEPGDVFLVQIPIEEQIKVYLDKGFLPMENLVTRLPLSGYGSFYRGWPDVNDEDSIPPRHWQFPKQDGSPADYSGAPLAAFPTYSFSVSRSGGLNMALPVQGVPIGLNLLDSASASGTITMKDAYTYGLPARTTFAALEKWSRTNALYLKQFEPQPAKGKDDKNLQYSYLRVVNRVYLIKKVDVSLFSDHAFAGSGSAGVPKEVNLLDIGHAAATENFAKVNTIISNGNQSGAAAPPVGDTASPGMLAGGSVKVAMATSRSISLVETFARPLVIGYLAFDYKILKDGKLDAPVATLSQLEGRHQTQGKPIEYSCDANCQKIDAWLDEDTGNQSKLNAWLKDHGGDRVYAVLYDAAKADLRAQIVQEVINAKP